MALLARWTTKGVLAAGCLLLPAAAAAHVKWFQPPLGFPLRLAGVADPLALSLIGGVLALTAAGWIAWRARGRRPLLPGPERFGATDDRRAAIYGLIPLILGLHTAVPLFVGGVQGTLFSPDNQLPGAWRYLLGLAQTGVALMLFYGALTRLAAVALAALWAIGVLLFGFEPMLENVLYLGLAVFFFSCGRGPISIDRLLFPRLEPSPGWMERGMPALRVALGLALVVVAFTEKFANLPLALAFLRRFPLNFTSAFGLNFSDELFIYSAGAVELLVGLWIMLGMFPRLVLLIAWIPVNMTLTVFNWVELVGHLPIYGAMAALLVWAPDPENRRLWLHGLRGGPLPVPTEHADAPPETAKIGAKAPQ